MVVIDMSTFKTGPVIPDDEKPYQARCIEFDAQRAAAMKESPEKSCFWRKGTDQYHLWMRHYSGALRG